MKRANYLCILLIACTLTPAFGGEDDRSSDTAHLKGEAKDVADWLLNAQRAGWEDHDSKTYNAQWADDAELTWARSAEPGPHDYTVNAKQISATRKMIMAVDPTKTTITPTDISATVSKDSAQVDWRIKVISADGGYSTLTAEQYRLVKTDAGWAVKTNRAWVLKIIEEGKTTVMTEKEWARRDAVAKRARESGDTDKLRFALLDAYRFGEAHDTAVKVTKQQKATAEDWAIRGWMAGIACRHDDMLPNYKKAIEMDPDVYLPDYARKAIEN